MHSMMCSVNHNLEGQVGRRISLKRQEGKVKNLGMVHLAMVPTKKTKRQDQITNATIVGTSFVFYPGRAAEYIWLCASHGHHRVASPGFELGSYRP